MPDLPTIAHVTLTVSDLDRSIQWYERLFEVAFHRDEALARSGEPSGLSKAERSLAFTNSPIHLTPVRSMSVELAWTIWHSPVEVAMNLRRGRFACPNSVSTMVESSMRAKALGCLAVTQTTSPWSSSPPPPRNSVTPSRRNRPSQRGLNARSPGERILVQSCSSRTVSFSKPSEGRHRGGPRCEPTECLAEHSPVMS